MLITGSQQPHAVHSLRPHVVYDDAVEVIVGGLREGLFAIVSFVEEQDEGGGVGGAREEVVQPRVPHTHQSIHRSGRAVVVLPVISTVSTYR